MVVATAPGKVILVGEHAVVYGRPAIAAPVWETLASAVIDEAVAGSGCTIDAPDVHLRLRLVDAAADEPLALVTRLTLARLNLPSDPDWRISVTSQIPIASGLGSGAALSAALVRAIYRQAGCAPNVAVVSELVYASEKRYHGTPSGIDNTVVAYGKPVWFVIGSPPQVFTPGRAFRLAIADTGIPSPTKETVAAVRRRRHLHPAQYEAWFDEIAGIVMATRRAMEQGVIDALGPLFNQNQEILAQIGVSSEPLDRLVDAAVQAGSPGAKLSGGGGGGNMIALVDDHTAAPVGNALLEAGAKRVIITTVGA